MKKTIMFAVLLSCAFAAQAQFKAGLRLGLSTTSLDPQSIMTNDQSLSIALEEANYGIHAGVFARISLAAFYIQPEVLFNSSSADFKITELGSSVDEILQERYQYVDVPILVGLKMGPLRLQAGPVGHFFINSASEIKDKVTNYQQTFDDMSLGYQAGIGLDIGKKILLDLKYEGNFSKFGNHINIDGNAYEFDQNPARIVASLGIAF